MNYLLQMEYFIEVAKARSFSEAAKKLYISQQTLSAHISHIEQQVGTLLFERTRPLTITFAGKMYLKRAQEIIFINSQLEKELKDIAKPTNNILKIGISYAYARVVLPKILDDFYCSCPTAIVNIYEMAYEKMDQALNNGEVDLILTRFPCNISDTKETVLFENSDDYLFAPYSTLKEVYGKSARKIIEKYKSGLENPLNLVKDCPFIIPRSGTVYTSAVNYLMEKHITPSIRVTTESLETSVNLCRKGLGITIAPEVLLRSYLENNNENSFENESFKINQSQSDFTFAIYHLKKTYVTYYMQKFIESAKKTIM